jgi:hypothetical protein
MRDNKDLLIVDRFNAAHVSGERLSQNQWCRVVQRECVLPFPPNSPLLLEAPTLNHIALLNPQKPA